MNGVIRTILKIILASPILLLLAIIVLMNIRLVLGPSDTRANVRLVKELRSLKVDIDNGADVSMQRIYPEGYVFLNATYGLAWCNLVSNEGPEYFNEGHAEIQAAWKRIDSELGRSGFNEELPLAYGSFYRGWNNFLLAKKLSIEPVQQRSPQELAVFQASCESIATALTDYTYPVSYGGSAWPADVMVCMASLAMYDDLFDNKYDSTIQKWIRQVRERTDENGMIPHAVVPATGKSEDPARGSSQSLMLILLAEIDREFAVQQFQLYKTNFLDTRFGLTGIREYPKGQWKLGDIDSGPLVFGFGAAATTVGIPALTAFGDAENATRVSELIEAAAMPVENATHRFYLFGQLPMLDGFIAWGHSLTLNSEAADVSFLAFHFYSILVSMALLLFAWVLIKPAKPNSSKALTIGW